MLPGLAKRSATHHALSDAAGALATESFEEGLRRGAAFTRWLHGRAAA